EGKAQEAAVDVGPSVGQLGFVERGQQSLPDEDLDHVIAGNHQVIADVARLEFCQQGFVGVVEVVVDLAVELAFKPLNQPRGDVRGPDVNVQLREVLAGGPSAGDDRSQHKQENCTGAQHRGPHFHGAAFEALRDVDQGNGGRQDHGGNGVDLRRDAAFQPRINFQW